MTARTHDAALDDESRRAFLVLLNHRLSCVPTDTTGKGDGRYVFRDDLDPGVGGDGCVCGGLPLKVSRTGR